MYWTGTVLVVSHTTGGGGVRASDVTHYFPTSQNYYFFCKNGSKRAERVENRVLGGVVVSASDIIEHCPHQIAVFSSSSSTQQTAGDPPATLPLAVSTQHPAPSHVLKESS